jgi:hypothetical protein
MSALPGTVAVQSLFARLERAQQDLHDQATSGGMLFIQQYAMHARTLKTVNLGEDFSMAPMERGAGTALRTTLGHLLDVLQAYSGLAPHKDQVALLTMVPKFRKGAKLVCDRAYATAMRAPEGSRIKVFFENMVAAYVDHDMPKLIKRFKRQVLSSWQEVTPIQTIREAVLALMYEWAQAVEDTAAAFGLQRLDEMTEKNWLEALQDVWPHWVEELYLTNPHQFGGTVEELFHFLQIREPQRIGMRRVAGLAAVRVPQDFSTLTVEEALQLGANEQLTGLYAMSRQLRCWRCLGNHYLVDCRAERSAEEVAGAPRPWPPMPVHPSQAPIHQLAVPAVPSGDLGLILTTLDEIRADMLTQQLSMQDQQVHQEQMASALLQLSLAFNGPGKKP